MRRALGPFLLLVGTALSLALMSGVYALWTATTTSGGTGDARATTLAAGSQPGVAVLGTSVSLSWAATTLPDGQPVDAYEVRAYDASTGAPRSVGAACAGSVTTTSCTESSVPSGSWQYAVVPRQQAWAGPEGPPSAAVIVDPDPPTVATTFPADGGTYTNALWNAACAGGAGVCGTAADALTGVTQVEVSLLRVATGTYWNGSSFASATEVLLTATGTTSWRLSFGGSGFPAEGQYTARAVATDGAGNTASVSATFTIDRTAPSVAIASPLASTAYGIAEWDSACAAGAGICGTASDAASSVTSVQVSIRQGTSSYWDGSAFASPAEVLFPATGTTAWSLAFPSSSFPANGSYRVRAVATDAAGQTASQLRAFTMDVTRPEVTALALVNGGGTAGAGKITPGSDSVRMRFSERLSVASICSAWSGDTTNQSLSSDVVVTVTDDGVDDTLSVAAGTCDLHIGSVGLGGDYVTATSTFDGTVTWTVSGRRITITIGTQTSGTLNGTAQSAGTATVTPDAAITDVEGNPVVTTPFSATGQRL